MKELLDVACVIQVLAAWHGDVSKLSAAVSPGEALASDAILADHSSGREVSIVCHRGGGGWGCEMNERDGNEKKGGRYTVGCAYATNGVKQHEWQCNAHR